MSDEYWTHQPHSYRQLYISYLSTSALIRALEKVDISCQRAYEQGNTKRAELLEAIEKDLKRELKGRQLTIPEP